MSEGVIAIVPARIGSKGIPHKNFRLLAGGRSAVERAIDCALMAGLAEIVVSSDCEGGAFSYRHAASQSVEQLYRPPALARDDTPMIDVVKHVLAEIPGPPEQIIVLLQPTQPLRKPEHITQAIALLERTGATSVASVVEVPADLRPELLCELDERDGQLQPWRWWCECGGGWADVPTRRQDAKPAYKRDGTVYAFYRRNLTRTTMARTREARLNINSSIFSVPIADRRVEVPTKEFYGLDCRALIIDPADTCPLDTEADWLEAERRLRARA